jgi:hypothetical protein
MSSTQEPATLVCYVFFCGNCAPRPAWLLVGREYNRFLAPMYPDTAPSRGRCPYGELMLEPGEGWVTKPSRLALDTLDLGAPQLDDHLLPLASNFFLCERQDHPTSSESFQHNLLSVLLPLDLPEQRMPPPVRDARCCIAHVLWSRLAQPAAAFSAFPKDSPVCHSPRACDTSNIV